MAGTANYVQHLDFAPHFKTEPTHLQNERNHSCVRIPSETVASWGGGPGKEAELLLPPPAPEFGPKKIAEEQ